MLPPTTPYGSRALLKHQPRYASICQTKGVDLRVEDRVDDAGILLPKTDEITQLPIARSISNHRGLAHSTSAGCCCAWHTVSAWHS